MLTKRDNYATSAGVLAVAGTPTNGQFKFTNLLNLIIDGFFKTKAATDNIAQTLAPWSPLASLAAAAIAASKTLCLFVWVRGSDAAVFLEPAVDGLGALKAPASITGTSYRPGVFEAPTDRAGYALVGAIRIATNASGAYTPGTTSLAAANQTVTYYDFGPDLGVPIPY